jgi:hypothetical protein
MPPPTMGALTGWWRRPNDDRSVSLGNRGQRRRIDGRGGRGRQHGLGGRLSQLADHRLVARVAGSDEEEKCHSARAADSRQPAPGSLD